MLIKSASELGQTTYQRFLVTKDGVSPRAIPGTPGLVFKAGSDEHDEYGEICEDPENRIVQMNKRMRKQQSLLVELSKPKLYGPEQADITLISWGSTKHACIEAMQSLETSNYTVNVLHFIYLFPLDEKVLLPILRKLKKAIVVENNFEAQFAGMLKEYVGFVADDHLLKYDGLPFYPEEIAEYIFRKH